jgi:hypothetical protein
MTFAPPRKHKATATHAIKASTIASIGAGSNDLPFDVKEVPPVHALKRKHSGQAGAPAVVKARLRGLIANMCEGGNNVGEPKETHKKTVHERAFLDAKWGDGTLAKEEYHKPEGRGHSGAPVILTEPPVEGKRAVDVQDVVRRLTCRGHVDNRHNTDQSLGGYMTSRGRSVGRSAPRADVGQVAAPYNTTGNRALSVPAARSQCRSRSGPGINGTTFSMEWISKTEATAEKELATRMRSARRPSPSVNRSAAEYDVCTYRRRVDNPGQRSDAIPFHRNEREIAAESPAWHRSTGRRTASDAMAPADAPYDCRANRAAYDITKASATVCCAQRHSDPLATPPMQHVTNMSITSAASAASAKAMTGLKMSSLLHPTSHHAPPSFVKMTPRLAASARKHLPVSTKITNGAEASMVVPQRSPRYHHGEPEGGTAERMSRRRSPSAGVRQNVSSITLT